MPQSEAAQGAPDEISLKRSNNEESPDPEDEITVSSNVAASTIPDAGLTAWLQCAGSFSLLLNSFGIVNSFGGSEILPPPPFKN